MIALAALRISFSSYLESIIPLSKIGFLPKSIFVVSHFLSLFYIFCEKIIGKDFLPHESHVDLFDIEIIAGFIFVFD
jgi:hypothetical protein